MWTFSGSQCRFKTNSCRHDFLIKNLILAITSVRNTVIHFAGEKLRELSDRHGVRTNIFDLSVDKDSILIPCYQEKTLHCYKLK